MSNVAVLGCGPAGLLAAHAVALKGHTPFIFSRRVKSKVPGAQFIHWPIPGVSRDEPDGVVDMNFVGTNTGYAQKVYGDPDAETSWGLFKGQIPIWSMRDTYDRLWEMYCDQIREAEISRITVGMLSHMMIVSTIPLRDICAIRGSHTFESQPVWVEVSGEPSDGPNLIIYNGDPQVNWYRCSSLFGHGSIEFSHPVDAAPGNVVIQVEKPLRTNCNCHPTVLRAGRYGEWSKPVLAHQAFERVRNALQ